MLLRKIMKWCAVLAWYENVLYNFSYEKAVFYFWPNLVRKSIKVSGKFLIKDKGYNIKPNHKSSKIVKYCDHNS